VHALVQAAAEAEALSEPCPAADCASRMVFVNAEDPSVGGCAVCGHPVVLSSAQAEVERRILELIAAEDAAQLDPEFALFSRGITVRQLNAFTARHGCWDLPTWQVVREVILPATVANRSRYFDLIQRDHPKECGPPDVFISHAWSAKWGALVGAASYGSLTGDRRIWIDALAVRQWPGSSGDLNFGAVARRCRALVQVLSHEVLEESNLNALDLTPRRGVRAARLLSTDSLRKLPLSRSWCLAELVAAYSAGRRVLVLAGESIGDAATAKARFLRSTASYASPPGSGPAWAPGRPFYISSFGLVDVLRDIVSFEEAQATLPADRARISTEIERTIGFKEFDTLARAALLGASPASEGSIITSLICDDNDQLLRQQAPTYGEKFRLLASVAGAGLDSAVRTLIDEFGYEHEHDSMPALWAACAAGRLSTAALLIDRYGASVEVVAGNGATPLAAASGSGNVDLVRFLLSRGVNVNARAFRGATALMDAAQSGHLDIVALLRDAGADVNLADANNDSALTRAVRRGETAVVRALITEYGADIDHRADPNRYSPLHFAAAYGYADIVEILVAAGAAVNAPAGDGITPLTTAALFGASDVARQLVQHGALAVFPNELEHEHVVRSVNTLAQAAVESRRDGDASSARRAAKQAAKFIEAFRLSSEAAAFVFRTIARASWEEGDFPASLAALDREHEILASLKNEAAAAASAKNRALILAELDDAHHRLATCLADEVRLRDLGDTAGVVDALTVQARLLSLRLGQPGQAATTLIRARDMLLAQPGTPGLSELVKTASGAAAWMIDRATRCEDDGQFTDALALLSSAELIGHEFDIPRVLANASFNHALLLATRLNDPRSALPVAEQAAAARRAAGVSDRLPQLEQLIRSIQANLVQRNV
jgi:hypothetical protein